ncbi:MAG: D-alanine--D-alanine ligase [Phycisphaerae bacterium]|nr:D-alanine--D-alanine ligase [Phycisphaerae bacterium]
MSKSETDFRQLRVLVLAGGPGAERQISLASGQAVAAALRSAGHQVIESDIAPDNLSALETQNFDVVFPIVHGTFGEDGQLQLILEQRNIPYVGSNSKASRLAMDKHQAKKAFELASVATAQGVLIKAKGLETEIDSQQIIQAIATVGVPCVVKPNAEGSSIGVVIGQQELQLIEAIEDVLLHHGDCLIEQWVMGREFTVGILAGEVLPILEVKAAGGFYDFDAKYIKNDTQYSFDLGLPDETVKAMQADALACFHALGCRDLARVDFILNDSGAFALEVNTLPGFTQHSLVPKAAQRAGMTMEEICDKIVQIAYDRPK